MHSKTCHLALDYCHISLMFSLAIALTIHAEIEVPSSGVKPLYSGTRTRELCCSSKQHKHITLVRSQQSVSRADRASRAAFPEGQRGSPGCEPPTPPDPRERTGEAVRGRGGCAPRPCRSLAERCPATRGCIAANTASSCWERAASAARLGAEEK